jgi:hypothetical protein
VAVRNWGGGAEGPGKAGVAPTASLNGMRGSEKAKVPEKASPDDDVFIYSGAKKP